MKKLFLHEILILSLSISLINANMEIHKDLIHQELVSAIDFASKDEKVKHAVPEEVDLSQLYLELEKSDIKDREDIISSLNLKEREIIALALFRRLIDRSISSWSKFVTILCYIIKPVEQYSAFYNTMLKHKKTTRAFALINDLRVYSDQIPPAMRKAMSDENKFKLLSAISGSMRNG